MGEGSIDVAEDGIQVSVTVPEFKALMDEAAESELGVTRLRN